MCGISARVEARRTDPAVAGKNTQKSAARSQGMLLRIESFRTSSTYSSGAHFVMQKSFALILAILVSSTAWSQQKGASMPTATRMSSAAFSVMQGINPERIRAHTRFLSHDLLEGRGTGQRGGDVAAEYIATQFATYGLKPAGD